MISLFLKTYPEVAIMPLFNIERRLQGKLRLLMRKRSLSYHAMRYSKRQSAVTLSATSAVEFVL